MPTLLPGYERESKRVANDLLTVGLSIGPDEPADHLGQMHTRSQVKSRARRLTQALGMLVHADLITADDGTHSRFWLYSLTGASDL